jgi:ElaB/YqjD/DUF883 family membrane-anchored ribosome-binding protein
MLKEIKKNIAVFSNAFETGHTEELAMKAGKTLRSVYDSTNDEITHAADSLKKEIRSNPVRSSAVAFVAGVLIGVLFRR